MASRNDCASSGCSLDTSDQQHSFQAFLRIRPLLAGEDEQPTDYLRIGDEKTLTLTQFRNADSDAALQKHRSYRYKFTKIFDGEVPQKQFFYETLKNTLQNHLRGQSCLILSCGSRNSGKTYTIQGDRSDPGLIARILDTLFNSFGDRIVNRVKLKPTDVGQVRELTPDEEKAENLFKRKLLDGQLKQNADCFEGPHQPDGQNEDQMEDLRDAFEEAFVNVSNRCKETLRLEEVDLKNSAFSVWVSFVEVYDENVFDLLETFPSQKTKTRRRLLLMQDEEGNSHLRGVTKVCVSAADEAIRLLLIGQRNLRSAVNLMNSSYDGGHYLFCIEVVRFVEEDGLQSAVVNRLVLCDLANSESAELRPNTCCFNLSWLTINRCLNALRENVTGKHRGLKPRRLPFGDSKLTKLLTKSFSENGLVTVIANASPVASTSDETVQVMNFAALAAEVINDFNKQRRTATDSLSLTEAIDFQPQFPNFTNFIQNLVSEEEILQNNREPIYNHLLNVIAMLHSKIHDNERKTKEAQLETRFRQEIAFNSRSSAPNDVLSSMSDECNDAAVKYEENADDQNNPPALIKMGSLIEDVSEKTTSLAMENKLLNVEVHSLKENLQKLSRSLAKCRLENAQLHRELDECLKSDTGPNYRELQKTSSSLIALLLQYNLQFQNLQEQINLLEKEVHLRQLLLEHRESECVNPITSVPTIEKTVERCNKSSQTLAEDKLSSFCTNNNNQHLLDDKLNVDSNDVTMAENDHNVENDLNKKKNCYETQGTVDDNGKINQIHLLSKKIKYTLSVKCERLNITDFNSCINLKDFPQLRNQFKKSFQFQQSNIPRPIKKFKKSEIKQDLDDPLPNGWFKKIIPRTSGKTTGKKDVYYFSPEGKMFRSIKQLKKYLFSKASHR